MKVPVSKLGESGTNMTGKSHEKDVAMGEGKHNFGKKIKVRDAKHVGGVQAAAQKAHERRETGGADPMGGCGE